MGLLSSGKQSCSLCREIERNALQCPEYKLWVYGRCSGFTGKLAEDFIRSRCMKVISNMSTHKTKKKNDRSFCYLGDLISSKGHFKSRVVKIKTR